MDKYKVAVIGLGRIGAQLEKDPHRVKPCTHLAAWAVHRPRCEVAAICDSDPEKLKIPFDWAVHLNGPETYTDYQVMMNEVHPDIVSIATPQETHAQIARNVVRFEGVKLVFLEKPIHYVESMTPEANLEAVRRLLADTKEFKVKLAVNHTRRWDPIWQAAAKLCSEDKPLLMNGYFSGEKIRDGVHMADLVNWFNPIQYHIDGPPTSARAAAADYLLFEVDLFWKNRRLRITSNGQVSKMYMPSASQNYEGFSELQMTCQTTRSLYPESSMYLATKQLLDCVAYANDDGFDSTPYCTGEHGRDALKVAMTW